ncbi:hypothetical protein J6590_081880 [Homalodisca vitripennis]|nr:hypothetical protein J6590_081880 [Homalodisca vitripennis]
MGRGSSRSLEERFICSAWANEIMSSPREKAKVKSRFVEERRNSRRNSGKEYLNYKNEVVPEKVPITEDFTCSCSHEGCKIIQFAAKLELLYSFYDKTYSEQTYYLASLMEISEPARRRVEEAISQRHCTVKYRLYIDQKSIQIRSDDPSRISLRKTHNLLETRTTDVILKTPRGRRPPQLETLYKVTDPLEFPKMYGGPLPISKGKKDNLLAMLELLPEEHRQFYQEIPIGWLTESG